MLRRQLNIISFSSFNPTKTLCESRIRALILGYHNFIRLLALTALPAIVDS